MCLVTIKMTIYGAYSCSNIADQEMMILGRFFASDVGCDRRDSFKQWALNSKDGDVATGNCTLLEKRGDFVCLSELCKEDKSATKVNIPTGQFIDLFDVWQARVVMEKPKEVVFAYRDGMFALCTSDDMAFFNRIAEDNHELE